MVDSSNGGPGTTPGQQAWSSEKVLVVVDDDLVTRNLVEDVMSRRGYTVLGFETAEESVPLLEKGEIPVALVDINLPGMSGIELVRLFAGNNSVAFILFTGDSGTYSYDQAIHEGATDFLLKPVRLEELTMRIEKAHETRRMRLAQERLVGELERLAITDELTSLSNRRRLMQRLSEEAKRAGRYGRSLAALALDIDHFKKVNDSFGHAAGDAALRALGDHLRSDVRIESHAYRSGGDEFTVLLPETPIDKATDLAQRLLEEIRNIRVGDFPELRLAVSIGVAEYGSGETPAQLLDRADRALYAAKGAGRNQVVTAPTAVTD